MADPTRRRKPRPERSRTDAEVEPVALPASATSSDESERLVALLFARVLPLVGAAAALVAGLLLGLAPALLVLAGTALLGTIGFFWASLRTLSGDAPLPSGVAAHALAARTLAPDRRRETLRALKDLELERSIGKIDEADYLVLSTRYRALAKSQMKEMDDSLAPRRERAEELVRAHLSRKGLASTEAKATEVTPPEASPADATSVRVRLLCPKCATSNEPDASFCKKCGSALGEHARAIEEIPDALV